MRLRTANAHRKRAQRRSIQTSAFDYHRQRTAQCIASGTMHKLKDSGFIRRLRKRQRAWLLENRS